MSNDELHRLVDSLALDEALEQIADEIRLLFDHISEDERISYLTRLIGDASSKGNSNLAHL